MVIGGLLSVRWNPWTDSSESFSSFSKGFQFSSTTTSKRPLRNWNLDGLVYTIICTTLTFLYFLNYAIHPLYFSCIILSVLYILSYINLLYTMGCILPRRLGNFPERQVTAHLISRDSKISTSCPVPCHRFPNLFPFRFAYKKFVQNARVYVRKDAHIKFTGLERAWWRASRGDLPLCLPVHSTFKNQIMKFSNSNFWVTSLFLYPCEVSPEHSRRLAGIDFDSRLNIYMIHFALFFFVTFSVALVLLPSDRELFLF